MPIQKLTEEQVRAIHADRRSYSVIAKVFGVTTMTVSQIKAGQTWKHLKLRPVPRRMSYEQFKRGEARKEKENPE